MPPFIMPYEPKFLFRVQHEKSKSRYIAGLGVVATHNLKYSCDHVITKDGTTSLPYADLDNKKDSLADVLNHLSFYSEEHTSCISTSESLNFAIYWTHKQHAYGHSGLRIFVIDVGKIKTCNGQIFHAGTVIKGMTKKEYLPVCSKDDFYSRMKFANSFEEWIVTINIPDSAIIRILPWELVLDSEPCWYPPKSAFKNGYGFDAWKMDIRNRKWVIEARDRRIQAIRLIQELAADWENQDMATFAEYIFNELFHEESFTPTCFSAEALALELRELEDGPEIPRYSYNSFISNRTKH